MEKKKVIIATMMAAIENTTKQFYNYFKNELESRDVELCPLDDAKDTLSTLLQDDYRSKIHFESTKVLANITIIFVDYYNVCIRFKRTKWLDSEYFHPEKLNDDSIMDKLADFLKGNNFNDLNEFVDEFNKLIEVETK
jgi:hypothetical protein